MLFFVVDDEPIALKASGTVVQAAYPEAEIMLFHSAKAALCAISDQKIKPDVVLSDIEMPGANGLDFAVCLKRLSPHTRIIFVTGYSQYALDAFRIHAHGYILKPMTIERVKEGCSQFIEVEHDRVSSTPDKLQIRCFGYFEVFWKGKPLLFSRKQTKELFAYLIDRKGDTCTSEEIATVIWEDEADLKKIKTRVRTLISDLRHTLEEIGMDELLVRRSGRVAIQKDLVECDYYRMLEGDMEAVNVFEGDYMVQYSWAELTAGRLLFGR